MNSPVTASRWLAALLLGLAASCATPQGPPMPEIASEINNTLGENAESVIVPGDLLVIRVLNMVSIEQVDLDIEVLVLDDGTVVIPGMGAVHVVGRTPGQLTEVLRESMDTDLALGSKVSVNILAPAPRQVHVLGAVRRSGVLDVPPGGHLTLVEALAASGGVGYLTSYLGNTLLVRWDAENQRQVSWIVDARTKWWGKGQTILLQPNDVIFIPDTPVVKVNIWIDRYIVRMIPWPRFIVPGT